MLESIHYRFCSLFFPRLVTSKMKVTNLKKAGVKIGKGTVFFNAGSIIVDASRPELVSIGEYCKITGGTIILAHDYSRSVLRRVYGDIVGEARKTAIGNNVFIGMNTVILMGSIIGDNCIVGAGSVCHGIYQPNSVIAGNPAKVIMTLDDYYEKRKTATVVEAKNLARIYQEYHGMTPSIRDMGAFFPLYLKRDTAELRKNELQTKLSGDVEAEVIEAFIKSTPVYDSFEDFLKDCGLDNEEDCCSNVRISQ